MARKNDLQGESNEDETYDSSFVEDVDEEDEENEPEKNTQEGEEEEEAEFDEDEGDEAEEERLVLEMEQQRKKNTKKRAKSPKGDRDSFGEENDDEDDDDENDSVRKRRRGRRQKRNKKGSGEEEEEDEKSGEKQDDGDEEESDEDFEAVFQREHMAKKYSTKNSNDDLRTKPNRGLSSASSSFSISVSKAKDLPEFADYVSKNILSTQKEEIVANQKIPEMIKNCEPKQHQKEGFNWLVRNLDHNLNSILGDEMGLGKTLQTICILAYLVEIRHIRGPFR